jgi:hypothetical protein
MGGIWSKAMKISIRLVKLRFYSLKNGEEKYCVVGVFYLPAGENKIKNTFVKYSRETANIPLLLLFPEMVFPDREKNEGERLSEISIAENYKGYFVLEDEAVIDVEERDIPQKDGRLKIDKYLFIKYVVAEGFHGDSRIYRFSLHRYFEALRNFAPLVRVLAK